MVSLVPTSPFQGENIFTKKADIMLKEYRKAQKIISGKLLNANITPAAEWRYQSLMRQIEDEVQKLNGIAAITAKKSIADALKRGAEAAQKRLKDMGVVKKRLDIDFVLLNRRTVEVIAQQMAIDLMAANDSIKRMAAGYLRATQQKVLTEQAINEQIAQGVIQGATRRTVSDALFGDFISRMDGEKFIHINGRDYQPSKYAELVARTRTREAASAGTINTCEAYGCDLVQVSIHEHKDCEGDRCPEFAGKIFSISGDSSDFPKLTKMPPFHPNCAHVLLPVSEDALRLRGQYETLVDFSNGEKEIDSVSEYSDMVSA